MIDASAQTDLERNIFHASYQEFRMKSQAYNPDGDLQTFSQMKAKDGRANSLHYKISFAALHFLAPLNNKIPVLTDVMGKQLDYDSIVFELIESDIMQIKAHKVGIKFTTGTYVLHQVIGTNLVLSAEDVLNEKSNFTETFTLNMETGLAITSYRELNTRIEPDVFKSPFKHN
ncbi:hypothetical protein RG47T_0319 [Mucilaginibacter polytrichastri]|uniref:Uncharacterized protein n=1 Tax=Mucilaginibacter polytrichastri TaxID=1302689 RepID=A0A1Q5ZSY2_9SPHI|nr:hypothetical protein RG47T_0319 [Mucilaginibacter polytrichastri]